MPSLTRRSLFRFCGAMCAGWLAGCTAYTDQSATPSRLGGLMVVNHDLQSHTVHSLLLEDETPVYWATKQVAPAQDSTPGTAIFEDLPAEPGDYVLHVRTDTQPKSDATRFNFSEYDDSCLNLDVVIGDPDDSDSGSLSIWKATNSDECTSNSTANR